MKNDQYKTNTSKTLKKLKLNKNKKLNVLKFIKMHERQCCYKCSIT